MRNSELRIDWLRLVIPFASERLEGETLVSETGQDMQAYLVTVMPHDLIKSVMATVLQVDDTAEAERIIKKTWSKGRGANRYDYAYRHKDVNIYFNNIEYGSKVTRERASMGVMIEFTGQGCREAEWLMQKTGVSWYDYIRQFMTKFEGCHATRVDLARDIYEKNLRITPSAMRKYIDRRQVVSSARHWEHIQAGRTSGGPVTGDTLYIGKSPRMLRIYDKTLERIHGHGDSWRKASSFWIRWELQLGGDYAKVVIDSMMNGELLTDIYFSILRNMIRVVNRRKVAGKNPPAKWWSEFVASDKTVAIHHARPTKNPFLSRNNWLSDTVAHSMVMELLAYQLAGGKPADLMSHWLKEGKARVKSNSHATEKLRALEYAVTLDPAKISAEGAYEDEIDDNTIDVLADELDSIIGAGDFKHSNIEYSYAELIDMMNS